MQRTALALLLSSEALYVARDPQLNFDPAGVRTPEGPALPCT